MAANNPSAAGPQPLSRRKNKPFLLRLAGTVMIVIAFVIAIGVPLLLSGVTGFNLWQGEGQSMQPTFSAGEFLITRDAPVSELQAGDIVLFDNGQKHVMHRIVSFVLGPDGQTLLITRGDNNPVNDPPVPESALVGKLVYDLSWLPTSPVDLSGSGLFVAEWMISMALAATGMLLRRNPPRQRLAAIA